MTTNLKALQAFSGPDGDHAKDEVFTAKNSRVDFLVSNGFAEATKEDATADENDSKPVKTETEKAINPNAE